MKSLIIDESQVKTFFSLLWPGQESGFLSISSGAASGGLQSKFFSFPLKMDLVCGALNRWSDRNLWFGLGLLGEMPSKGRGTVSDVIACPGVVADIDCKGGVHKTDKTFLPTKGEALDLIRDIPFKPSIIIWSGGGYQVYWLFPEPWIFEDEADKEKAKSLSSRWKSFLVLKGKEKGWKIDSTASLEHLFRIPGTYNCKSEPFPVSIVEV